MRTTTQWCLLSCKDTNFKANHNTLLYSTLLCSGVCYLAKIRILKQITTFCAIVPSSNWCLLSCKDTNFKANHNRYRGKRLHYWGVCYLAKIRILKQITTTRFISYPICRCLLSCKDTNFKANHNLLFYVPRQYMVFVILQRYEF